MVLDLRLVDFEQSITEIGVLKYEQRLFVGLNPLMVKVPKHARVLQQRGRAVGWANYPKPAAALFPSNLLEDAQIEHKTDTKNRLRHEVTWSYVFWVVDDYALNVATATQWPTTWEFY